MCLFYTPLDTERQSLKPAPFHLELALELALEQALPRYLVTSYSVYTFQLLVKHITLSAHVSFACIYLCHNMVPAPGPLKIQHHWNIQCINPKVRIPLVHTMGYLYQQFTQ